ncbi:unnamed protein product, partial [Iphiclides podalirius]
MDGVITDHSDSDSGESWTILEHSPQDSQDVPDFTKDSTQRVLCNEKDEDTDGISIISDSDHDNSILLTNIDEIRLNEQEISAENHMSSHIAVSPQHSTLEEKDNLILPSKPTILNDSDNNSQHKSQIKKVSYADSVKLEQKNKLQKEEIEKKIEKEHYESRKKRMKKHIEPSLENVVSEEEIKKDDRYNCHKCKNNRKKTEKWRKKQLRRTKYDRFEINDQLKIFDENKKLQENESNGENSHHISNVNLSYKTESQDNLKKNLDKAESTLKANENPEKEKRSSWYEKRAAMRKDSRKELELELFGEQNLNDSGWYFRRMKRREQCRAKANNITNKKGSKLNMNFKMKY